MQTHLVAHHHRHHHVALHLLHDEHDHTGDQRVRRALRGERHQDGERAGGGRPHDRDERTEERDDRQRDREGDVEHEQADADDRSVDQSGHGEATHVGTQRRHRPATRLVDRVGPARARPLHDPAPHRATLVHEEEREDHAEEDPGEHLADEADRRRTDAVHTTRDDVTRPRPQVVDLLIGQRERRVVAQVLADVVADLLPLDGVAGELVGDQERRDTDHPAHDDEGAEQRHPRGEESGQAEPPQAGGERAEEGRDEHRHQERDDHDAEP